MKRGAWALRRLFAVLLMVAGTGPALGQSLEAGVNPGYHEPPDWFKASFLDLPEDVAEARGEGKRLMLYFYQDGCPYCGKLIDDNFGRADIERTTRRHFEVLAINMWGDRQVTGLDGETMSEKAYARKLGVKFTPTLIFLDEQGRGVLRIDGYYQPDRFHHALRYAAEAAPGGESLRAYLARVEGEDEKARMEALPDEPFFMDPPYLLDRRAGTAEQPLLVLFESRSCSVCRELHDDILQRPETRALLERFEVVRLDRTADTPVLTPTGERTTAAAWARELGIDYEPGLVFFNRGGEEVFRVAAYLRAFHFQSVLDYVASGAYREEPEFQRFVQERAEHLEEQGVEVELWE